MQGAPVVCQVLAGPRRHFRGPGAQAGPSAGRRKWLRLPESGWRNAGEGAVPKGTCRLGLEEGALRPRGRASGGAPRMEQEAETRCGAWKGCDTEGCTAFQGWSRQRLGQAWERGCRRGWPGPGPWASSFPGAVRTAGDPEVQIPPGPGGGTGGRRAPSWGPGYLPRGQTTCFQDLVWKGGVKGLWPAGSRGRLCQEEGRTPAGTEPCRLPGLGCWTRKGTVAHPRRSQSLGYCARTYMHTQAWGHGWTDPPSAATKVGRSPQAAPEEHGALGALLEATPPAPMGPGPQTACEVGTVGSLLMLGRLCSNLPAPQETRPLLPAVPHREPGRTCW